MRIAFVTTFLVMAAGCSAPGEIAGAESADEAGSVTSPEGDASRDDVGSAVPDTGAPRADSAPPKSDTGGAAPPDTGATSPPAASLDAWRVLCVDTINKYRATEGKKPYAGWTSAGPCSDAEAKSDSETGTAHGAFGKCGERAQNECPGWPGPPESMLAGCLKMMWDEGPGEPFSAHGHYINMSSTSYSAVACGFYQTPKGNWWSVQNFQ